MAILFFIMSVLLVIYMDLLPEHHMDPTPPDSTRPATIIPKDKRKKKVFLRAEEPTELPVIVWWTPFTPSERTESVCPAGTCIITQSRTELRNSRVNVSAFLYYGSDFDLGDLPLPRQPHHLWALLHEESPKNNWVFATEKGISLFNITSTVSRYSDYPLHLHYLHTLPRLLQPIRTPVHLKSKGLGLVMFMQSTCNPPSDRDSYVRELMKYITVDSYGKCLHNKDLPADYLNDPLTFGTEAVLDIVGQYKFVLSFENALCHDYFTEKFWRPLYAGSVPIVRGSPTIRDWDPSGTHPSMILADDFDSPKALAEFLLELDKNPVEYGKYLSFKKTGVTNRRLLKHFQARKWVVDDEGENFVEGFECHVCDTLHRRKQLQKILEAANTDRELTIVANSSHYNCLPPVPSVKRDSQSIGDRLSDESRTELDYWMWHSKCAVRTASVLVEAISRGLDQEQLNQEMLNPICGDIS